MKNLKMCSYYPESKVETKGFMARYYDALLNIATFGKYSLFTKKAIQLMGINSKDKILDLGTGTGENAYLMTQSLSQEGNFIGIDISWEMISQFKRKCAGFPNAKIINARIDETLPFKLKFDKVFISFVLHGFPQAIRETVIKNVFSLLKNNGSFFILDYNEFSIPFYLKIPFELFECPYMFDFIKRDWEKILSKHGFNHFEEYPLLGKYVRLIKVTKNQGGVRWKREM